MNSREITSVETKGGMRSIFRLYTVSLLLLALAAASIALLVDVYTAFVATPIIAVALGIAFEIAPRLKESLISSSEASGSRPFRPQFEAIQELYMEIRRLQGKKPETDYEDRIQTLRRELRKLQTEEANLAVARAVALSSLAKGEGARILNQARAVLAGETT